MVSNEKWVPLRYNLRHFVYVCYVCYIYIHPHISCNRWLQISISQYRTQSYCHTVDRQNVAPIGKRPEHDTQWDLYKEFVFKILTLPIYPVWLGRHTRSTDVYWAQLVEKYFEWKKSGTNIYIYKGMYIYIYPYVYLCQFSVSTGTTFGCLNHHTGNADQNGSTATWIQKYINDYTVNMVIC